MGIYKIAENGKSIFHIVAHQHADETTRFAASELQKYLLKSTGAAVPYFSDRCPMRSPEIRIGAGVRKETFEETDLPEESFRIRGEGEHIVITGNTSRGVLYGVYYFLERFCGFACFTKDVETIDKHDTLEIELDEIVITPTFEFRDTYFRFAFDGDFCTKNRSNTPLGDVSAARGGRVKWFNFHHSFSNLVPHGKYFASHPEYFSLVDGERIPNGQLCLTNPEVAKIAEQTLRMWIKENPECHVFSVAQNDNKRRCTCPNCLALEEQEGSPAGPIIHFVNHLADAIKEDHPNVLLHTFAYQYSVPAPKHAVARDNVIVRLCDIDCRFDRPLVELAEGGNERAKEFVSALSDWKNHAGRLYVWDYVVNFRNYLLPFVNLHTVKENLLFFKATGVRGVLEQGNFAYGGGAALDDLKSYVISRLLVDPELDVDKAIESFCLAVYGKEAGKKMIEYVQMVMAACESHPLTIYQNSNAEYITDDLVNRAEAIFSEALRLAEREEYRERIEREYLSVRFMRLSRMDLEMPSREALIREFFTDLKRHGLTEIRERQALSVTRDIMLTSQYAAAKGDHYPLYYIMQ